MVAHLEETPEDDSELRDALGSFAASLTAYCTANNASPPLSARSQEDSDKRGSAEVAETDDEVTIKTAFIEFAKIIHAVEDARSMMLTPFKPMILNEIQELRSEWLLGPKTDPKDFLKETTTFCQKLEKYLSVKQKERTPELDEQMLQDRQRFITRAFEHVTNIHEAEELKKSKFVQTISLFMQMMANFYHQAFEHFQDSQRQLSNINQAAQRSAANFRQISDETKELKEKLLKTPWEQVQSNDSAAFREGYLFIQVKKPVTTLWIKHFCTYSRDLRSLQVIPYTQGRSSDLIQESYSIKTCTRRSSETIDRRFCFDVEVDNRSTPLTLQAQSQADLLEWLRIMDGQEPLYADRFGLVQDNKVNPDTRLETQGIYRISGVRLKVTALVRQAMSPPGLSKSVLSTYETHMLTSAVKHFVRNLDEPLVTFALHHEFIAAIKRNPSERVQEVARLINLLPRANQRALQLLMSHLAKVSAHSRVNSMTPSNLGIVFAPSVMRSPEETVAAIMNTKFASSVVELMIEHHATLFPSTDGELLDTLPMPVKEPVPIEPVYSTPVLDSKAPSPREARLVDLGLYRPAKADNATSILATVQHQPVVGDTPNASKAAGDVLGSNEDLPPRPPVPPRLGLTSPRRRQSEQNKRVLPSRPSEPSNRIIITHPQPINDDVDRPNIGQLVSSDNNSRGEPDKMEDLPPRVPGKIQRPHGQSAVGFPNVLSLTSAFNHQPSIPPQPPVRKRPDQAACLVNQSVDNGKDPITVS
ncbi:Rho GTPase-activating protein 26 [Clonorchis sinensis]|uniref:Rho GTPase-activating protein 26 n=1 Tax=Clonorchis sinensis TaxID=79923 RepID=H2KR29_CLOSI|nr:Rho GTPase-activating protein 26 [Clonorchis sinensis]